MLAYILSNHDVQADQQRMVYVMFHPDIGDKGEYTVSLYINGAWQPGADYYTEDREDALKVAHDLLK